MAIVILWQITCNNKKLSQPDNLYPPSSLLIYQESLYRIIPYIQTQMLNFNYYKVTHTLLYGKTHLALNKRSYDKEDKMKRNTLFIIGIAFLVSIRAAYAFAHGPGWGWDRGNGHMVGPDGWGPGWHHNGG
jgi:hypothetical protein